MNAPDPVPATPAPVTAGAIPWYKSPQEIGLVTTAVSAAIAMFPKIGLFFGLKTPTDAAGFVTNVFAFIAFAAPLAGSVVRWRSKGQPLTVTQSAADIHPSTLAVVETQARMAQAGIPTAVTLQKAIEAAPTAKSPGDPKS